MTLFETTQKYFFNSLGSLHWKCSLSDAQFATENSDLKETADVWWPHVTWPRLPGAWCLVTGHMWCGHHCNTGAGAILSYLGSYVVRILRNLLNGNSLQMIY